MSADTFDVDAEPVGVRHARTGFARYRVRLDFAPDVRAINGVNALERPRCNHIARADRNLLGRLEDDAHLATQAIAHLA